MAMRASLRSASLVRELRNTVTSAAAIVVGWRLSWNMMKRVIQATVASSAAAG
jgi:hypothetical protein